MFEEVIVSDFIENATLRANNCTIQHFIFYVEKFYIQQMALFYSVW